ncbi:hypothetical protein ILYODFUR_037572, partial [Ilyodon furcidens]
MKRLVILLMFCSATSAVVHTLKVYFTGSSGLTNYPAFEAVGEVDGIHGVYCQEKIIETKTDWVKKFLNADPQYLEFLTNGCHIFSPAFFRFAVDFVMTNLNQSEGVHIFQGIGGCELNNETAKRTGFLKYGYDGEDFLEFDLTQLKWIALRKEALFLKQLWDEETQSLFYNADLVTNQCNQWLIGSLIAGQSTLLRT